MDEFVCGKLDEWGLSELKDKFKDHKIDKDILCDLEDEDINELIPKIGLRRKFKKQHKLLKVLLPKGVGEFHEESSGPEPPSERLNKTDSGSGSGKRKLDAQEPTKMETPSKRLCKTDSRSNADAMKLSDVKNTMGRVKVKLQNTENTKLNAFLKTKIDDLEVDKREIVGVFGKTGAGKSSLINAVIGQKNLLPSGSVNACTSVMIKVEANMHSNMYEAEIEFITEEEWKDELWSVNQFHKDKEEEDDELSEITDKLSALYGDEWKTKSPDDLMESKYFREIPEFLASGKKILTCESAKELSAKFVKYTRSDTKHEEDAQVTRWYWPLVKCVTLKVPNNDLLQHVTLVDLPGNGQGTASDLYKSRDQMWKGNVSNCSTVWIVTEINRAASDLEAWEILESCAGRLGNGGQCQRIHFICTKSDLTYDLDDHSDKAVRDAIFQRNADAKRDVQKEFNKISALKKHFSDDCLKVFTVSSREFFQGKRLNPEETEIPALQEFLRNLNDCHSETLNYVSGARGILSLIQGASGGEKPSSKAEVCEFLLENLTIQYDQVHKEMNQSYTTLEDCLQRGVENSKSSSEKTLRSFLYPKKNSNFYGVLKRVVTNGGVHKKRKLLNLNMKLASFLTDSIDEEFKKTFLNDDKSGPFNGAINKFCLITERLIRKYRNAELQLIFLKTEEEKLKSRLNKVIRERKKTVYSSLMETIEENMQPCYKRAAEFTGTGSLDKMRETIKRHVFESKNTMFDQAKNEMMTRLKSLMMGIQRELWKTMKESIELSLKSEEHSFPDVHGELAMVQKLYDELQSSSAVKAR